MFRVQLTVRRLMALVAVVALLLFAAQSWQRRIHYQAVAKEYARRESGARCGIASIPRLGGSIAGRTHRVSASG